MRIQKQLLLGLGLLFGGISFAVYLSIQLLVIPNVLLHEEQGVSTHLNRIKRQLDSDLSTLASFAKDWGTWDDTYHYIQVPNTAYEESNLPSILTNTGTDLFTLVNKQGKIIQSIHRPFQSTSVLANANKTAVSLSGAAWPDYHPLRKKSADVITGIIATQQGMVLFAKSAITQSNGDGPSQGELIFGRYLNNNYIQQLNQQLESNFTLELFQNKENAPYKTIKLLNDTTLVAELLTPLYESKEYFLSIKLRANRPMYQQTLHTLSSTLIVIICAGALLSLAAYIYLRSTLVNPIINLTNQATHYGNSHTHMTFTPFKQNHELGELSAAFIQMAKSIDQQRTHLEEERSHFQEACYRDPLTALYNRRYMSSYMDNEFSKSQPCLWLIILIDIDHFKQVNDLYGHNSGDKVLQQFSKIVGDECRDSDIAVRYGGEEFLLILKNQDEDTGQRIAERIRTKVEAFNFVTEFDQIRVTASIGFASIDTRLKIIDQTNWSQLLNLADIALYTSKHNGRNTWIGFKWKSQSKHTPFPTESLDIPLYLADNNIKLFTSKKEKQQLTWN